MSKIEEKCLAKLFLKQVKPIFFIKKQNPTSSNLKLLK